MAGNSLKMKSDAQAAIVSGTGGAFKTRIALAHAKWVVAEPEYSIFYNSLNGEVVADTTR